MNEREKKSVYYCEAELSSRDLSAKHLWKETTGELELAIEAVKLLETLVLIVH